MEKKDDDGGVGVFGAVDDGDGFEEEQRGKGIEEREANMSTSGLGQRCVVNGDQRPVTPQANMERRIAKKRKKWSPKE